MIKSTVSIFFVLSAIVTISMAVPSTVVSSVNKEASAEYPAVQMYTDVTVVPASEDGALDESRAVSPFTYKAVMLESSGRKVPCWRCSSPCSAGFCCDDGFPQCCLVNGQCRCCRR